MSRLFCKHLNVEEFSPSDFLNMILSLNSSTLHLREELCFVVNVRQLLMPSSLTFMQEHVMNTKDFLFEE